MVTHERHKLRLPKLDVTSLQNKEMLNGPLYWHFLTLIVPDANMWCSLGFKNDTHFWHFWCYDKIKKCNFNTCKWKITLACACVCGFKSVFFIVTECYDTKLKTGPWDKYFFVKTLQFTNTWNLSKHPNKHLHYKYTTAHQFLTLCFINLRLNHIKYLKCAGIWVSSPFFSNHKSTS